MSVSAELLRLGLRWTLKRADQRRRAAGRCDEAWVQAARERIEVINRLVQNPPKGTQAISLNADGVKAVRITTPESRGDRYILYLHGGAYAFGSPETYRNFIWRIAAATSASVLFISYRLAPEHPFPAALDDAVKAYSWLLAESAVAPRVAVMDASSGGGLVFATLLRLRDEGLPLPAAAVALSPRTDLALTGASVQKNADADPLLTVEGAASFASCYAAGADPFNPYVSPLYGDPAGLPPTFIQVGSDEILLDDSVRMAEKLRAAGCHVEIEIWPRMPHVWQLYARFVPEARQAIERIGAFVQRWVDVPACRDPGDAEAIPQKGEGTRAAVLSVG